MPAESDQTNDDDAVATAEKAASYKKKQILVAVLLVGLLTAILTQPEDQDVDRGQVVESTLALQTEAPTSAPAKAEATESPEMRANRLATIREFSRIELDQIMRLELLAPEPQRMQPNKFDRAQRVQAIYGTSTDRAALVGQSIVRSGQPLPDGQKVLSVTTGGIQLAR